MSKQLKVYFVNDDRNPIFENIAREVQDSDIDTMRKAVVDLLRTNGYTIRSVNFHQDGSVIAYVNRIKENPVESIKGWVYKKPQLPSIT